MLLQASLQEYSRVAMGVVNSRQEVMRHNVSDFAGAQYGGALHRADL